MVTARGTGGLMAQHLQRVHQAAAGANASAVAAAAQGAAWNATHLLHNNASAGAWNASLRAGNGTAAGAADDEERMSPVAAILVLYSMLLLMLGAQAGLFYWKSKHKRSYELVTLTGLWLMPAIFSLQLHFWRFLLAWGAYTAATGALLRLCIGKRTITPSTPGKIYSWFLAVHKVSSLVGVCGYALLVLELLGVTALLEALLPRGTAFILLWYGLYFGILNRDCAEVASDRIAAGLTGGRLGSTVSACGVCGGELHDGVRAGAAPAGGDRTLQLSCKHCFHELCIRGWTVVGKKARARRRCCPLPAAAPAGGVHRPSSRSRSASDLAANRPLTLPLTPRRSALAHVPLRAKSFPLPLHAQATCPVCLEKVDLAGLYADRPWETQNLSWIQMLDAIRYMVVWNPIIFTAFSVVFHIFGPHHHHHGPPGPPGGPPPPFSPLPLLAGGGGGGAGLAAAPPPLGL